MGHTYPPVHLPVQEAVASPPDEPYVPAGHRVGVDSPEPEAEPEAEPDPEPGQ